MPVTNENSPSPTFEINGVPVAIYVGNDGEQGGIIEQWSDRGLEVIVYFHCRWEDRMELVRGLRGTVAEVGGDVIRDILPFTLPQNPLQPMTKWNRWICTGTDNFMPKKFRTDQDGAFTGLAGWGYYDSVVVPAHFMVTTYFTNPDESFLQVDPSGFPFTTTKIRTSGEVFSPPSQVYKFSKPDANGNFIRVEDIGVGVTRVRAELDITRHYMPNVPLTNIQTAIGKLNDTAMRFAGFSYSRGAILCSGVQQSDPYGDAASGLIVQDYEYTLIANGQSNDPNAPQIPLDWNQYMRPDNGEWDTLIDQNGNMPFRYDDLSHLIWPEYA